MDIRGRLGREAGDAVVGCESLRGEIGAELAAGVPPYRGAAGGGLLILDRS